MTFSWTALNRMTLSWTTLDRMTQGRLTITRITFSTLFCHSFNPAPPSHSVIPPSVVHLNVVAPTDQRRFSFFPSSLFLKLILRAKKWQIQKDNRTPGSMSLNFYTISENKLECLRVTNYFIFVWKGVCLPLKWSTYLVHMGYLLPYSQIQDWEFLLWTDCLAYCWDWEKVYRIDLGSQSFVETSVQTYNDFLMSFDILHNKNGFVGHNFIS